MLCAGIAYRSHGCLRWGSGTNDHDDGIATVGDDGKRKPIHRDAELEDVVAVQCRDLQVGAVGERAA